MISNTAAAIRDVSNPKPGCRQHGSVGGAVDVKTGCVTQIPPFLMGMQVVRGRKTPAFAGEIGESGRSARAAFLGDVPLPSASGILPAPSLPLRGLQRGSVPCV